MHEGVFFSFYNGTLPTLKGCQCQSKARHVRHSAVFFNMTTMTKLEFKDHSQVSFWARTFGFLPFSLFSIYFIFTSIYYLHLNLNQIKKRLKMLTGSNKWFIIHWILAVTGSNCWCCTKYPQLFMLNTEHSLISAKFNKKTVEQTLKGWTGFEPQTFGSRWVSSFVY